MIKYISETAHGACERVKNTTPIIMNKTRLLKRLSWLSIVLVLIAAIIMPGACGGYSPHGTGTISLDSLPQEAVQTLQLIKAGGPFPFDQDGTTFHNFEGLLPDKPDGYYREYTVITPGSSNRGARRIVSGENGEYYYTEDHYASFKLIREQ